jgi:translation initiation factor 5
VFDWGEDEDWAEDTGEEAVRARMEALSGGLGGLVIDNDMEKSEVDRINIFHKYVVIKKNAGPINPAAAKEILAEATRLEIQNKAPIVLCELLFDDKIMKEKQIKKYRNLLLRFTNDNQKAQKYLIGGLEKTIETYQAILLPRVPHIFKEFFEEDMLDEEVLLEWAKKVSKKYVSKDVAQKIHDKAAPFIQWLKEAEEESEDESEDDIDVDFDSRAHISKIKETSAEPDKKDSTPEDKKEEEKEDEDDDDVDIDNI